MTSLACDYCDKGIEDTPEENAWYGVLPYPGDRKANVVMKMVGKGLIV